ncbi:MAG: ThuA domain-containing protein [Spirochaetes bacterium]|nr:ThuA domain-containing protein [Spirochaetota bacterium]
MKKALVVYGGWDGHEPEKVARFYQGVLKGLGFEVELSDSLEVYGDKKKLMGMDLIVPHWTMGELTIDQLDNMVGVVAGGVGLAGCHAGLCDAFRSSPDWQFMAGGQLVAHVGAAGIDGHGLEFEVNIKKKSSPIVEGIDDFTVYDEQYYIQYDPAIQILATTSVPSRGGECRSDKTATINREYGFGLWNFEEDAVTHGPHVENKKAEIPVIWTKYWGKGKVFYCSLGHDEKRIMKEPIPEIIARGFSWASK